MAETKSSAGFLEIFNITDRAKCERVIRTGGIAAMISAGITAIFAGAGFFTTPSDKGLANYVNPWMTIDVALILVLGFFIFRKSRVASTIMVIYFAASKIDAWLTVGRPQGFLLSMVFLLCYIAAMRATYIWHKTYKNMPAEYGSVPAR
jgi:hypothetical protein